MTLRDDIAKTIFGRRWQLSADSVESMFSWYAEKPQGTDRSRMAIYGSFRDADAVLAMLQSKGLIQQLTHGEGK